MVQCYCCNRFGHFAKDCWSNKERKSEEANIARGDSDDEHVLLMAYEYDDDEPMQLTISNSGGDFEYDSESEDDSEYKVESDSEYESKLKDESEYEGSEDESESEGFKEEYESEGSEAEGESEDVFEAEGEVSSEEDSASEGESESENKSEGDSEDEEDSKGESDSEGESDSYLDSDDDPESGGNLIYGNRAYGGGTSKGKTFEDIDSDSEDELEPENDSESESESEGEIDYEEESDFDPDSDGDSDSSGSPDSWNILDFEGGHAYEVGTSEVSASDTVLGSEDSKQLVGSLRYLCNTRPDIYYAVGMMSIFVSKLKWSHYQDAVRILRYIKGTLKYGVLFPSDAEIDSELMSFSDSDWCGHRVDRRRSKDQSKQASEADD
ncbi:uncharacterized protein LOC127102580 [Lathyrus oleraceus]|uniref:uncharacterized protein LOC127102580 n=1 Tax=Pisum sativum TaxID=3888 RepID=UPI0021CFEBD9|nr:uncharacterized protein LOC127102580 [Pisum sativum]